MTRSSRSARGALADAAASAALAAPADGERMAELIERSSSFHRCTDCMQCVQCVQCVHCMQCVHCTQCVQCRPFGVGATCNDCNDAPWGSRPDCTAGWKNTESRLSTGSTRWMANVAVALPRQVENLPPLFWTARHTMPSWTTNLLFGKHKRTCGIFFR